MGLLCIRQGLQMRLDYEFRMSAIIISAPPPSETGRKRDHIYLKSEIEVEVYRVSTSKKGAVQKETGEINENVRNAIWTARNLSIYSDSEFSWRSPRPQSHCSGIPAVRKLTGLTN